MLTYHTFLSNMTQQVIKEEGTQENSRVVGTYILTELAKLRDKHEIIGDVRGKGLQIGVEMVEDKVGRPVAASISNCLQHAQEEKRAVFDKAVRVTFGCLGQKISGKVEGCGIK